LIRISLVRFESETILIPLLFRISLLWVWIFGIWFQFLGFRKISVNILVLIYGFDVALWVEFMGYAVVLLLLLCCVVCCCFFFDCWRWRCFEFLFCCREFEKILVREGIDGEEDEIKRLLLLLLGCYFVSRFFFFFFKMTCLCCW